MEAVADRRRQRYVPLWRLWGMGLAALLASQAPRGLGRELPRGPQSAALPRVPHDARLPGSPGVGRWPSQPAGLPVAAAGPDHQRAMPKLPRRRVRQRGHSPQRERPGVLRDGNPEALRRGFPGCGRRLRCAGSGQQARPRRRRSALGRSGTAPSQAGSCGGSPRRGGWETLPRRTPGVLPPIIGPSRPARGRLRSAAIIAGACPASTLRKSPAAPHASLRLHPQPV